jgi:transposase
MPVSGDTLLRMIRSAPVPDFVAPTIVGIDDWAWRRGQRYGTIICDLERNRVLDLLPDRNADSVADWLKRYPGIKVVARDRAGLYADGARRGAPGAMQVADRWHLLSGLGEALRQAVGRHRSAVSAAAKIMTCAQGTQVSPPATSPGLARLRTDRKVDRREQWEEICRLREQGRPTSSIADLVGIDRRTVQRWIASGGEPEHVRPPISSHLLGPYEAWLEARWHSGCQVGQQLWRELKELGYKGSRNTIARWAAKQRARHDPQTPSRQQARAAWKAPSRRRCAWYLGQAPDQIDTEIAQFLGHLYAQAPELRTVAELAVQFVTLLDGNDVIELDKWLEQAVDSELGSCGRHRPRHRRRERCHHDPLDDESGRRSDQQGQSHKAADVRTRKLPTSAAASLAGRLIIDQASKGLVEHTAPKMRKSPRSSRYSLADPDGGLVASPGK